MELQIGTILRRLRRERELTQEEVAAHLGVSFQAVSKWERGEGLPDIILLPALARYFDISLDDLFGMNQGPMAKKFEQINRTWAENNRSGLHPENVALMESALREYPNNALLLVQLSTSLEKLEGTDAEKQENLRRSIAVQEQILNYGSDPEVINATRFNICFAYWKTGQQQKAIEQAKKLPNLYKTRENALAYFLECPERAALSREALDALRWAMQLHLGILGQEEKARRITAILDE